MNYIEKTIEDDHTGAEVKYHEIKAYSVDLANNTATVTVASYISRKMREAGKDPVGTPVNISLNLAPPMETDVLNWFYTQLTQPVPADFTPPENPYYGYVNPYLFSDGVIKTRTPKDNG